MSRSCTQPLSSPCASPLTDGRFSSIVSVAFILWISATRSGVVGASASASKLSSSAALSMLLERLREEEREEMLVLVELLW